MLVVEIALVVALFVAGIVATVTFIRWHAARVENFWRAAAQRLGGQLTFRAGWFDVTCSIAVVLDGRSIIVTRGRTNGVSARGVTRHPPGFELDVQPRPPNLLVDSSRAVATGDATFDAIFACETTHPDLARAWLDAPARDAISRAGHVRIHVRDGAIVAGRDVFAFETNALEHLAHAVGAVAANGPVGIPREDPG